MAREAIKPRPGNKDVSADDEGDLGVLYVRNQPANTANCVDPPRQRRLREVFTIRHSLSTPLPGVGMQVWSGALLLSDWIFSNPDIITGHTVLELGAGVGLVSIVAGLYARRVYCTDTGDEVLANCQANVDDNDAADTVLVKCLDWLETDSAILNYKPPPPQPQVHVPEHVRVPFAQDKQFQWAEEQIADCWNNVDVILAADGML